MPAGWCPVTKRQRVHLTSPLVNLTTHIHDVVNMVLYEGLTDITLVGYSYGGFVVTGALDHIANRVSHLVYLDDPSVSPNPLPIRPPLLTSTKRPTPGAREARRQSPLT